MELGIIGLGRMGANIARRLLRAGHRVVAYNRSPGPVRELEREGAIGAYSLEELTQRLSPPRAVWLMVPAGDTVTQHIEALTPLLSPDDTVVDGGNSNYKDSMRRAQELQARGLHFLDVGTSGGIWGLEFGFCLMIGGERAIFERLEPIFKALAPEDGYAYVGPSGAGHFAKMIHNGIEYGLMEAYAEGFEILRAQKDFRFDLRQIAHLWNRGSVIRSWLLELTERIFAQDADLADIRGYVEDSGEGRWTVLQAIENDIPAPIITLSLLQRFRSRQEESFSAKLIAALRNEFGGHVVRRK
jgi:6-phosphogluconate dehydrogenase